MNNVRKHKFLNRYYKATDARAYTRCIVLSALFAGRIIAGNREHEFRAMPHKSWEKKIRLQPSGVSINGAIGSAAHR